MTNSIAIFQISTEEDLRFQLDFTNLDLTGRTLEVAVRERSSDTVKATLTAGSGLTLEGTGKVIARYAKASMAAWARGEYSADLIDKTGGQYTRLVPVRLVYATPGRTVGGIANQAKVTWTNNVAVITATGGVGPTGNTGPANTLAIGDVETLETGEPAEATITGTAPNQTLSLGLPRGLTGATGATGDTGATGSTGPQGDAATIEIGTVTTSDPGEDAEVENVGTSTEAVLNFVIPRGEPGPSVGPGDIGATELADEAVTDEKLRDSGALSVIGRAANSTGAPADIAAGTDGHVLRRSGTALSFGQIATAGVTDKAVTDAKLRDSAALSVLGRSANSNGVPADIAAGTDGHVLRRAGTALAFGPLAAAAIDPAAFVSQANARIGTNTTDLVNALRVADLVGFNLGLVRSEIATRYIPVNAFYLTGETTKGDIGAGALYIRGTSGGLRAIQDAAGTWWNLALPDGIANVGWFSAKGDGSTNDTTACVAAITAVTSTGGIVRIPVATFNVTSLGNIPPNVVIDGVSRTGSVIQTTSATADVITLNGSRAAVSNLTIKSSVARTAGSYITATTNCSRIFMKQLDLIAPFVGITLPYPSIAIVAIVDVDIVDTDVTTGRSVDINGGFSVLIDHLVCRLSSYAGSRPFAHINISHVEDIVITNSQLIGAASNLNVAPASGKHANLVRTDNTQFDAASGPAIRIAPTTGGTVENVTIDSPWIFGTSQDVLITNAGGGGVQNVSVLNSKLVGTGVGVQATGTPYISVRGCKIGGHATGVSFVNVYGGMVTNNLINPHGVYGANTVGVSLSGTTSNTLVRSNICSSNGTNVSDTSSGSASNSIGENI